MTVILRQFRDITIAIAIYLYFAGFMYQFQFSSYFGIPWT